jgi:hypothetical protein
MVDIMDGSVRLKELDFKENTVQNNQIHMILKEVHAKYTLHFLKFAPKDTARRPITGQREGYV